MKQAAEATVEVVPCHRNTTVHVLSWFDRSPPVESWLLNVYKHDASRCCSQSCCPAALAAPFQNMLTDRNQRNFFICLLREPSWRSLPVRLMRLLWLNHLVLMHCFKCWHSSFLLSLRFIHCLSVFIFYMQVLVPCCSLAIQTQHM